MLSLVLLFLVSAAQTDPARPTFEAASLKPANPARGLGPLRGGPGTNSPGQLSGTASLKALLMRAYDLKSYQVAGPAWLESERYDVAAKISAGAGKEQVALMLQSLLAERFRLAAHRETRQLPLYALTVGKNGPKFKSSTPPDPDSQAPAGPKLTKGPDGFPDLAPGSAVPRSYEIVVGGPDGLMYKLWARRESMQQLANRLSSHLNRAVVDFTALKGTYDFALAWTMESAGGVVPRTDPPPDEIDMHTTSVLSGPDLSIFTALPAQLGLRLEQRKGSLEILVVDRAEKLPIDN